MRTSTELNVTSNTNIGNKGLMICLTPLQMLQAEKIAAKYPDVCFDLLIIVQHGDNDKHRYYAQKLYTTIESGRYLYYVQNKSKFDFIRFCYTVKNQGFLNDYSFCFLANIHDRHIQYVISKQKITHLVTFDDGFGNIAKQGKFFQDEKLSFFKQALLCMFGIKYKTQDIRSLSTKHYTIFKDKDNIIGNTEYISLFGSGNSSCTQQVRETKKIFLGQPLWVVSSIYDYLYINKVLKSLEVGYYFPHPSERQPKIDIEVISTKLIFEDYIIETLKSNPDLGLEIYSFTSTALFNVARLPHVKAIYVFDAFLFGKFHQFYESLKDERSIQIVDIDSKLNTKDII